MKTIEERASNYAETRCINVESELHKRILADAFGSSYVQGATEQKRIDIEKACQWLDNNASEYASFAGGDLGVLKEITVDFRKAMEEDL